MPWGLAMFLILILIASSQDIDDFEEDEYTTIEPESTPIPTTSPQETDPITTPAPTIPIANQVAQSEIPHICIALAAFAMLFVHI